MWIVVHFFEDDSVESVPNTWFRKKDKKCAWPLLKSSVKKMIQRRTYPNEIDFKWLPARILGRNYESLEEARVKANKAQMSTDLSSANEDYNNAKYETESLSTKKSSALNQNSLPSFPSLKTNQEKKYTNFVVSESESEENCGYDSDKDPEYSNSSADKIAVISPEKYFPTNSNMMNIINSPIGKIIVENSYSSVRGSVNDLKHLSQTCPISTPKSTVKRTLFMSEPSKKLTSETYGASTSKISKVIKQKEIDCVMPSEDFQKFVITSLTKIKYDIAALSHTVNASNMILENSGTLNSSNLSNVFQEAFILDEIFPIKSDDELQNLEQKIENDKQFRLNILSKLILLVGTKSAGDNVRRLMSKMFEDKVLLEYSLQGFKKKKSFQKCKIYRLLIDAIRVHPKFNALIDKEFDVPLATWLAHAKYRIINKNNI